MKAVALLLVFLVGCYAQQPPTVYAVITEFIDKYTETAIFTVSVDLTTGAVKNVTENFIYNGGSATVDGVSAFDPKTGIYWYATDAATPYIYSTNVYQKTVDPPLDTGATYVDLLVANSGTGLLWAIVEASNGNFLISVRNDGTVKTAMQFNSGYNLDYICSGAIDSVKNLFYLIVSTNASIRNPAYKIFTIDLASNQVVFTSPSIMNGPGFPQYFGFDRASGNLYGMFEQSTNENLIYSAMVLNPQTGFVSLNAVPSITGIITCSTYSNQISRLLAAETNGLLHFINPVNGKEEKPLKIGTGNSYKLCCIVYNRKNH